MSRYLSILMLALMLGACGAPTAAEPTPAPPTDAPPQSTATPAPPTDAPPQPTAAATATTQPPQPTTAPAPLTYFWPAQVPAGLAVIAGRSSADPSAFVLELADPAGGQFAATITGGPGSRAAAPLDGNVPGVVVRGQPGSGMNTGAGFSVYWREAGQPYAIISSLGQQEVLALAESLQPLDLAAWRQQLTAAESVAECGPGGAAVGIVGHQTSLCIVWADTYADETGFRVVLEYLRSGERFTYDVTPNAGSFLLPEADAPPREPTFDQCMARKDFTVAVIALRPGGETRVGSAAFEGECMQTPPPTDTTSAAVIYQASADGSVRALDLGSGAEVVFGDPTNPGQLLPWAPAPDGRSIALITGRDWHDLAGGSFTASLWTVNVDGAQPRRLLDLLPAGYAPEDMLADSSLRQALVGPEFARPVWTPDGQAIVVASAHEGQVELYAVAADGSGARRLTDTPDLEFAPIISPDGQEVAYASVSTFGTGAGWGDPGVWVQPLTVGARRPVVGAVGGRGPATALVVGIATDGSVIARSGYIEDGTSAIWVAARGAEPRAIYQGPAGDIDWNQAGSVLAFDSSDRSTQAGRLMTWRAGEAQPAPAADLPEPAGALDWSPDGRSLLVCIGELFQGDQGLAEVQVALWSAGTLRDLGIASCEQHAWSVDGRLAIGGAGAGLVADAQGGVLRPLPSGALPAGWRGDTLLFFAPSPEAGGRWQLHQALAGGDAPLGAPITVAPIAPMLVMQT